MIEPRGAAGAICVARDARCASQGAHRAVRGNLADGGVQGVRHIKVAGPVHRDAVGRVEPGGAADAIAVAATGRRAGDRGDNAGLGDPANDGIAGVGDIEIAGRIHGNPAGLVESRVAARSVLRTDGTGRARQRCDLARRADLADRVAGRIGDVEIARPIHREADRRLQEIAGATANCEHCGVAGGRADGTGGHAAELVARHRCGWCTDREGRAENPAIAAALNEIGPDS